jgi:hypothetical protein
MRAHDLGANWLRLGAGVRCSRCVLPGYSCLSATVGTGCTGRRCRRPAAPSASGGQRRYIHARSGDSWTAFSQRIMPSHALIVRRTPPRYRQMTGNPRPAISRTHVRQSGCSVRTARAMVARVQITAIRTGGPRLSKGKSAPPRQNDGGDGGALVPNGSRGDAVISPKIEAPGRRSRYGRFAGTYITCSRSKAPRPSRRPSSRIPCFPGPVISPSSANSRCLAIRRATLSSRTRRTSTRRSYNPSRRT